MKGKIITVDALHTDKKVAETILSQDNNCVMVVKNNQPLLKEEITTLFNDTSLPFLSCETFNKGHGRTEHCKIFVSSLLKDFSSCSSWPGSKQVFCITCSRTVIKMEKVSTESVYDITSLSPEDASLS